MTQFVPARFGNPRSPGSPGSPGTRRSVLFAGAAATTLALSACAAPGAAATTLALSACAAPGAGAPTSDKKPVSLRWSTWGDAANPMVQGAEKGIAIFKQKFPHISVTAEPQVGDWATKNTTEWLAGTGVDVSGSCCNTLPDWGRQGILLDLNPLIKRDTKQVPLSDYVAAQMNTWNSPERGQYALPMYMGIFGLYYSRTLFKRKGIPFPDDTWDWDKWQQALVRLTDKTENTWGYQQSINFPRPGILIRQAGGNQVDPKDNRKAVFDSPQSLSALQWLHDRMWKDKTLAMGSDITAGSLNFKNVYNAVAAGKLGTMLDGSWILARWLGEQPDLAGEWDVAQLPKGAAQRDSGCTVDGWCVWKEGKNKEESWEYVKFLQSDPWLEIATSIVGHQPSRKSWQDKFVELMKKTYPALADKNLKAFIDPIKGDYGRPQQFFQKDADAQKIWSEATSATFTKNEAPVSDTFKKAAQQINALHGI